jgi:TP901 family phage tail tape measure protein
MLDAGSVFVTLGGKFDAAAYEKFDAANKKAIASAEAAEGRMSAAVGRAAKAHEKLAQSVDKVASSGARLSEAIPLRAMDQWEKNSSQAGKNLEKLGSYATKGAAVGILAVGAGLVYAAAKATSFNREMLKVETQAGGTRQEVRRLGAEILKLAGTVPQGPKELSEGLYHIESAGFRGAQAMRILEASAKGAAIGQAKLEDTSNAVVGTVASQIRGVKNASDAMGQLNAIVGTGNMRMQDLAQSIGTGVLPTFAQAGLSLTDYGAALATVTDNSTSAVMTGTRLRMTIGQMVSPTKAAAKELASIGLSSTSLANDLRKPNGLLVAIGDLKKHLEESGKSAVEQDQILSNTFGRGKSSATIITLVGEYDRLLQKYHELGKADGLHKLAASWAEFQKSEAAGFRELKSGAEAFAITVGNVVLPSLTRLSREGAHALGEFVSSGGAEKVGAELQSAFSTLGHTISSLAPDVEALATALYHMAAAGVSVGRFFGVGLVGQLTTLASAFLAFKVADTVVPILFKLGGAIGTVIAAARTAPTITAFAGDLVALAGGPVGAIVAALTLAAGAFVAFKSGLFSSASAAERNAAEVRADKKAIEELTDATTEAAKGELEAKQAKLDHKAALQQLARTQEQFAKAEDLYRKGKISQRQFEEEQLQLEQAQLQVKRTALQVTESAADAQKKVNAEQDKSKKGSEVVQKRATELQGKISHTEEMIALSKEEGDLQGAAALTKQLIGLRREYNAELARGRQYMEQINVAEVSRHRLAAGEEAIKPENAQGVNDLRIMLSGLPKKIATRYELEDQDTIAKLGLLAAKLAQLGEGRWAIKVITDAPNATVALEALTAIADGVPPQKVIHILHNAHDSASAMRDLRQAINEIRESKHVTISTNAPQVQSEIAFVQSLINALHGTEVVNRVITLNSQTNIGNAAAPKGPLAPFGPGFGHASGRGSGESETALVGEGQGAEYVVDARTGQGRVVSKPTLMGLGRDDYVIPLEERFRGRALGLFAMLARDLGVPGYRKGRSPHHASHPHRVIPPKVDGLALPMEEVEKEASTAKAADDKAHGKVSSLRAQVAADTRDVRYSTPKMRAKNTAKLREAQAKLAQAQREERETHKQLLQAQHELRRAKAYQAKIDQETSLANIAGNDMKLADGRDDEGAYQAAKQKRLAALSKLHSLVAAARGHVKVGSAYFDKLTEQVQNAEIEGQTTEKEAFSNPAAEEEQRTGMTEAERKQLKGIEADIAMAALTPSLEDDKAGAQKLVSFLEGVLGEVQAEPAVRGGAEAIKDVADQLKTARSNLESLTTGAGANSNQDLQAQVNQERQRAEIAERQTQIVSQALSVFSGSGDIGAGGANAAQATIVQNNYMLHPSDPSVLTAVGNAAVAGMGYQGARRAVRMQVGP